MGKAKQGIFGGWVNKVGNVVARVRQGQVVLSIYQPNVANPRTQSQQSVRMKFTLLSRFMSACLDFVRIGFQNLDGYKYGSAYSAAVGYNYKNNPFDGGFPNWELAYSELVVAEGTLLLPYNMSGSLDSNVLSLSWTDNSGEGNAKATDEICVMVYNSTKGLCITDLEAGKRPDRSATINIPTAWNGDSVEVYAMCVSESINSNSFYIGNFTV